MKYFHITLSLSEVKNELDKIKLFLENNGCAREASAVRPTSAVDMVASLHIASMKQTTLHDYLMSQPENP